MKHLKPFTQFLNEGTIAIFGPGNPYKQEESTQWPGVEERVRKWMSEGQSFILVIDIDYDKYIADPAYRSVALGTWKDKTLSTFSSDFPKYREVEFDVVEVVPNEEKPREPWLRVVDKRGVEFLVPPFKVLDIQLGSSVRDGIHSGFIYLIDSMRAKITNYIKGVVEVKLQDGTTKKIPIDQWKRNNYTQIDESKKENLDTEA
jgi:hypothetical protein